MFIILLTLVDLVTVGTHAQNREAVDMATHFQPHDWLHN
jgi:hypothetical protein